MDARTRLPHLSIRARLILLSVILLAILTVSLTVLTRQLARDSEVLVEEARVVSIVRNANAASKHFGDLRYWLTDFAETLLIDSQQKATAAKSQLDADLKAIATVDPAGVTAISREVDGLNDLARKAADAYSSDDTAAGNRLLLQAKQHILLVDEELEKIVDRLEQQAVSMRDASIRQAELALNASVVAGISAILLALGLTALLVRSIIAPLRRLEHSMAAITRGELDASIPPVRRDEIGAMTNALAMLRDSLIARERLERERRRSEEQVRSARDVAETALQELRAAQANLIQAEKMASLGQLTAGIAHEIKNPLNFVNNFAGLSVELVGELRNIAASAVAALDEDKRAEFDETMQVLTGNLEKIVAHGKRADGIVRSMLLHSRGGSSDRHSVDVNVLLEEALNLAYHGARAQDQSFNVTIERDLQGDMAPIEILPQDMSRVFLNLAGNGFYAVSRRARQGDPEFRPTLKIRTRDLGGAVEIAIRDNGTGIAAEHRKRLFEPFFTTKPTGEGTGLGLSISYDTVTQQHGGTIDVESEPGQFTEFTVRLPRSRRVANTERQ